MKNWEAYEWVAFVLACTVPFFLVFVSINVMIVGFQNKSILKLEADNLKLWLGFMGNIVTGLLVWVSNNQRSKKRRDDSK